MSEQRQALKQRRVQMGYTQESFAHEVPASVQSVGEWERGLSTPRVGLRPRLATLLQVTVEELARMLDGNGATFDGIAVPTWLGPLAALEHGAARLWAFEPFVVHGLLQTEDYAQAIEHGSEEALRSEDIAQRVQVRLDRQEVLSRDPDPLELAVVLDESVLHRPAGGPETMKTQLHHLVEESQRPNVDLRVLPLDAGLYSVAFGAFTVLTASDGPFMASVHDRGGAHYLDRLPDVQSHIRLFNHLQRAALSSEATRELLHTVTKERYS